MDVLQLYIVSPEAALQLPGGLQVAGTGLLAAPSQPPGCPYQGPPPALHPVLDPVVGRREGEAAEPALDFLPHLPPGMHAGHAFQKLRPAPQQRLWLAWAGAAFQTGGVSIVQLGLIVGAIGCVAEWQTGGCLHGPPQQHARTVLVAGSPGAS